MNFKTTYVLFGILAAVLALFAVTQVAGLRKPTDRVAYVVPSLNDKKSPVRPDDIETIVIDRTRPTPETLVFKRAGQGWRLEKPNVRVQGWLVDRIVTEVSGARRDDKAEVSSDLKLVGLDPPEEVVTLRHKDGREWKLNLGNTSVGGRDKGVVYVASSDRPSEPLAVKGSQLDTLYKSVTEFRARDLLAENSQDVSYVRLDEPGKEPVILERSDDRKWRFQKPPYGEADYEGDKAPAPEGKDSKVTGVQGLLTAIEKIKVENDADFVEADAPDLTKYGLEGNKPERLRIEIERRPSFGLDKEKEKTQRVLLVGKKDEKGDKYFARLEEDRAVVRVSTAPIDALAQVAVDPAALRNRDLVRVQPRDIDAIDIKNAAGLLKVRGPSGKRKLIVGDTKPRSADDKAVQDFLSALSQPRQVQSFPDPAKENELGFDKPQAAVVSLWADGLQKDEKKEDKKDDAAKKDEKPDEPKDADAGLKLREPDKPTYRLTFGNEDKDSVYVRRETGGEKTLLAVPKSLLAKVGEGPLAFLERTLPSFSESADVTTIALDRGGEPVEAAKEGGVWKLTKPPDLAGRTADKRKVEDILAELRGLRPERWEAEGTVDLDKYGLKAPQIKVTVKLKAKDDKSEDWVYLFGKETPDKSGVYAKQEKQDLVFVVPTKALDTLKGDLEDPTVLAFDVAKVKELKLTGWKQAVGSTFTLQIERQTAGTWVPKTPPDFELDSAKAEAFAGALAGLKAQKFVLKKGGPQPEHKLGPKEATLTLELTVEGQKDPLTLTLGELDAKEKAYFAQSSGVPGAVFLLAEEPVAAAGQAAVNWKDVLKGPKHFSK
jgi:hypothetical protein